MSNTNFRGQVLLSQNKQSWGMTAGGSRYLSCYP